MATITKRKDSWFVQIRRKGFKALAARANRCSIGAFGVAGRTGVLEKIELSTMSAEFGFARAVVIDDYRNLATLIGKRKNMRTLAISIAVSLSALWFPAPASANGPLEASLERHSREIARWQKQLDAARRDIKITEAVMEAFFYATGGEPADVKEVYAALEPLRARFPDNNLQYSSAADYCRVLRTILSAETAAHTRAIEAARNQRDIASRQIIIAEIATREFVSELSSKPLSADEIANAFNSALERQEESEIVVGWSNQDYGHLPDHSGPRCD